MKLGPQNSVRHAALTQLAPMGLQPLLPLVRFVSVVFE